MDTFARRSPRENEPYIREAAARMGVSAHIIEKDFWVCWTLKRLFDLPNIAPHLTFKGGTSLSKAYSIIERFSEDIDVSIERDWLGFGGAKSPDMPGISRKEADRRIEDLKEQARKRIGDELHPALEGAILEQIGTASAWSLTVDPEDPQTLYFHYPTCFTDHASYIPPAVKIELGARADHWPAEERPLTPYVAEQIPKGFGEAVCTVRVLKPERTFWEKATHLHALTHFPAEKALPLRNSRHYYDLARLISAGFAERAASEPALLARVVDHKTIFRLRQRDLGLSGSDQSSRE